MLILFCILIFLMVANSLMVKYASKGLSWQQNLAYSRFPILFYDIYLVARYFRLDFDKYKLISLVSGVLALVSLPITYSLIKKMNISIYNQVAVISNGLLIVGAYFILHERFNNIQTIGIFLSVIAFILLMWGSQ